MKQMTLLGAMLTMCLALASCDQTPTTPFGGEARPDAQVDCAIGAEGGWSRDCALERAGDLLTIRHPDGGFRRFRILSDGRGLEAADGAEPAHVQIVDKDRIEVRMGGDRYRLPARMEQRPR